MIGAADVDLILDVVSRLGVASLLVLILVGGWRRWWVFSWVYQDLSERMDLMRKERDEWKEIALRSANLASTLDELRKYGRP